MTPHRVFFHFFHAMAFFNKKRLAGILAATIVASGTPTLLADDYAYVTAEHLNVRSTASVKGRIAAVVDKGYRVTVLESLSNGWKRVLLENGQEGYLNGKYVAEAVPQYEKVGATRYSVKVAHAFVRSDGLHKKIAVVDRGDQLEAVSDRIFFGRWIRVRVVSSSNEGYVGRVGYISKRLVDPVEGYQYAEESPVSAVSDAGTSMESAMADSAGFMPETESSGQEGVPAELNSAPAAPSETDDIMKLLGGLDEASGASGSSASTTSESSDSSGSANSGNSASSNAETDDIMKLLGDL